MALYPQAELRLWNPYNPERTIVPRAVIVHTNAVNAEDPGSQGGLSWHFQCGQHGAIYQHRDTETRAAANAGANDFAISIETWDGGDPEGNPWNPEQLDALVALIGWCCDTHGIPRVVIDSSTGDGIGFHRMFAAWDIPYHSCPGNTRAQQFYTDLMPRIENPAPIPTPDPPAPPQPVRHRMNPAYISLNGVLHAFVVGADGACYYHVNGTQADDWRHVGGLWTSGLSVIEDAGAVVIAGRGNDGALWEMRGLPGGTWSVVAVGGALAQ